MTKFATFVVRQVHRSRCRSRRHSSAQLIFCPRAEPEVATGLRVLLYVLILCGLLPMATFEADRKIPPHVNVEDRDTSARGSQAPVQAYFKVRHNHLTASAGARFESQEIQKGVPTRTVKRARAGGAIRSITSTYDASSSTWNAGAAVAAPHQPAMHVSEGGALAQHRILHPGGLPRSSPVCT